MPLRTLCGDIQFLTMPTPSLLIVPARFKSGKLYSQVPTSGTGDFTVTRATSATRVNASGLIESVASGIPRLDYFASGGVVGCPALLVEPSGSNLALQSENFGTTWNPANMLAFGSGSVLNTTATLDPYGTNVADFIVGNTTVGQHRFDQTTTSVSGSYTLSVFVKAGGYSFTRLRIGLAGAVFDLSSGVVVTTDAGITSSIQSFGNGWFRCIIGKAASAANEIIRINMQPTSSTADFAGDGTSGIYVFGAQYETGSVATSYIPTTTAAVTRNADVVLVTGAVSGSIGQTQGTIYAEVDARNFTVNSRLISISNGTQSNRITTLFFGTNVIRLLATVGGLGQVAINSSSLSAGIIKFAIGYALNDYAFYVNGVQVGTSSSALVPACNAVILGSVDSLTGSSVMNDRIRAVALYTTRLTNAELAALTTP